MKPLNLLLYFAWLMIACGTQGTKPTTKQSISPKTMMMLRSPAFENGQPIPKKYTGDDQDLSPELIWGSTPQGTRSFALICQDPDAPVGTFIHWVIYNIPDTIQRLPEGFPRDEKLPDGICQGRNDFGAIGYRGPLPPPGKPHRYFFILYALDTILSTPPGATASDIQKVITGHTLATAELIGTYRR